MKCFHKSLYPSQIQKKCLSCLQTKEKVFLFCHTFMRIYIWAWNVKRKIVLYTHTHVSRFFLQSLIFSNKDPSKPYLPTRCYLLSRQKYTNVTLRRKESERKIHKSPYELLNNKLYYMWVCTKYNFLLFNVWRFYYRLLGIWCSILWYLGRIRCHVLYSFNIKSMCHFFGSIYSHKRSIKVSLSLLSLNFNVTIRFVAVKIVCWNI